MASPTDIADRAPFLISIGGLPATGKTTIARKLAVQLCAAYVRVDSIETAISQAEGQFENTNGWESPPGYRTGHAVASDQLRNGLDVVVESVNPLGVSRDGWRDAGLAAGGTVVEVEVICSDLVEHRRRAEERILDIPGMTKPSWDRILNREYDQWERDRLVIDTAVLDVEEATQLIRSTIRL